MVKEHYIFSSQQGHRWIVEPTTFCGQKVPTVHTITKDQSSSASLVQELFGKEQLFVSFMSAKKWDPHNLTSCKACRKKAMAIIEFAKSRYRETVLCPYCEKSELFVTKSRALFCYNCRRHIPKANFNQNLTRSQFGRIVKMLNLN